MKNSLKKLAGVLALALAFVSMPAHAFTTIQVTDAATQLLKDNLVGGWEYTVEGAPQGYDSGLLMIVKAGDTYKVQIQLAAGVMNATNIVVKGNDISFKVMVEGESVSVSLTAKGSKISGTSSSSAGVFAIAGVKSISPQ